MSESKRGAPRNEASRLAILRATSAELARRGWDGMTIEGIATAAGVGKQTIYRWWSSRSALVADCLLEGLLLPMNNPLRDTGDIRADLQRWLELTFAAVSDPNTAALYRSVTSAALDDEAVAVRLSDALGAADVLVARLESARASGEIGAETRVQAVADALVGSILVRLLERATPRDGLAKDVIATVLAGVEGRSR
ncbi:TetR/AcrR family transcriptional regulator [Paenarthrobacter nicotinovorans]|uniref:TetR/AcrR family transcriptional regulator n=1 Tax=Paenarthrobacter nicotinovorans TaxID=29320 RepID=UPI00374A0829